MLGGSRKNIQTMSGLFTALHRAVCPINSEGVAGGSVLKEVEFSLPQIEFYSVGGPGRNTTAEEILVFGPDQAIEQQGSGDDQSFASGGEIRSRGSSAEDS